MLISDLIILNKLHIKMLIAHIFVRMKKIFANVLLDNVVIFAEVLCSIALVCGCFVRECIHLYNVKF